MTLGQPGRTGRRAPHRSARFLRLRRAAPGLLAVLALAGCAIPVDGAARPVANPPTDLGNTTSSSVASGAVPDFSLELYFVNESDQLIRVRRPRDSLATAQDALTALANPTDEEITRYKAGLNSKLGPLVFHPAGPVSGSGVLAVKVEGEELRGFVDTAANRVNRIYAQIVCTLTALDSTVKAVQIVDGNGPIPVKVADAPETRPISPADFNKCATAPTTPPTTTGTTTDRPGNTRLTPTTTTAPPSPPSSERAAA